MLPEKYHDRYFQVSVLLSCHRAWRDAHQGIENLEKHLEAKDTFLWEWRVSWVGICSLLRASVHLFGQDAKACHNKLVAQELKTEWDDIAKNRENHTIYWEFINKERNAILKEYQWMAYEQYLDKAGSPVTSTSAAALILTGTRSELRMENGFYHGRPCIEVVKEASNWVHNRIESAVTRAGFSLDEQVHFLTWSKKPKLEASDTILGQAQKSHGDSG